MGTSVKAVEFHQPKFSYTVATVAAASVAVADDELLIFIGDTFAGNKTGAVEALKKLANTLRKLDTPTPTQTANLLQARGTYPLLFTGENIAVTVDNTIVVPSETQVAIYMGKDYQQIPGASITGAVNRLTNRYMEDVQKAA